MMMFKASARLWCQVPSLRIASLKADPLLVNLPAGVGSCCVFRNVINDYDEELIIEELSRILPKEGQEYYADPSKLENKVLRNLYLELYGFRDFTETKNWRKKEVKRIPGLVWSPTLMRLLEGVGRELLGGELPDAARVVEHHLPGYEMHTEHPTVGRAFLYLNLMSDTVLTFDDEATQRQGEVYLPQRSLMMCSGEVRWGWRFGEHPHAAKVFVGPNGLKKRLSVPADMRLSIQLWKFDSKLVDRRQLQDDLEAAVKEAEIKSVSLKAEKEVNEAKKAASIASGQDLDDDDSLRFKLPPKLKQQLLQQSRGGGGTKDEKLEVERHASGSLGGDLASAAQQTKTKKSMPEIERDMAMYKQSFSNVQGVMQEMKRMQDTNEVITDEWIKEKVEKTRSRAVELDTDYGYDPSNPEATWDEADRKARLYKQKLKDMNYDGDASREAKPIDLGFDPEVSAPLDIKQTLQKLAPHMKDGEKMFGDHDMTSRNRGM